MRIGIDARELCGKPTGVGRHLAGLLGAWSTSAGAQRHQFFLYTTDTPTGRVPPNAVLRIMRGNGGTLWEQTRLRRAANDDRVDVFFAPGYTAPLRLNMPVVVLIHDLSFVSHPEWFRLREGLRRRLLTQWAGRRARIVLAVSEAARGEIISLLGLPPNRVRRIYPGIANFARHSTEQRAEGTEQRAKAREPLVLYVGSLFNRRHLPDLIEAFKLVWQDHPEARLEIVGDDRTYPRQRLVSIAAAEGLQDIVMFRSYVPDAALADLYRRARALAFLSEYEGFGHPPLEALAAGVPAVLLDTAVARETCLDAALYVKPQVKAIAIALTKLLYEQSARTQILEAAPGVLARYSWTNAAQQTLDALEDAAR